MTAICGIADRLPPSDRVALVAQAEAALVLDELEGRSLDVEVSNDVPILAQPNGPLHPIPGVLKDGVISGELILWIRSGRLTGVEQPWFGDEPPDEWPDAAALQFS